MQSNKIIFFTILGLAILVVIGLFMGQRWWQTANPIELAVLYSTEKEAWLEEAVANFNGRADGRPIRVNLEKMGSREIYLSVLDGSRQPDVISPASSLQIAILQNLSAGQWGTPVVSPTDPQKCRPVVTTPLVMVAWQERAKVLWGDDPNGHMWLRLHDASVDPKGWENYGHPEWGYIKFGHTDPLKSNSGFMTILLMSYNYLGKTSGLTSQDILANADYQQWFKELEGTISEFGDSTGTYMQQIVTYGPSKYDLVAVYESTAIEQAENAVGRYGPLQVYYPPATVLSDHPFCILNSEWVTPEKTLAAQAFTDYLLSQPVQQKALFEHGFRPVDPTIPLDQPGSPFSSGDPLGDIGLEIDLPPPVELPPGDVLNTLLDFWSRSGGQ
jgi:ABC-type Fe3+ transport system substrate-binding protein